MASTESKRLVDVTPEHIAELFQLLKTNDYYYHHMNEQPSVEGTRKVLVSLPPGANKEDKINKGVIVNNQLAGFVEIVKHYPDPECGMIGLLIVDKRLQGAGIGSFLLNWTLSMLKSGGMELVFLSYSSTNLQSQRFWQRNGFYPTGDVDSYDDIDLVAMEKKL